MSDFGCVVVNRIEDAPVPVCFQLAVRYDQAREILGRGERMQELEAEKPSPVTWDDVHGVTTFGYPGVIYTLWERHGHRPREPRRHRHHAPGRRARRLRRNRGGPVGDLGHERGTPTAV